MPNFDISLDHLLLSVVALIIWATRLESKVINSKKDMNGIGKRVRDLESETKKDIKEIQLDLVKLSTCYKCKCCEVLDDNKS